MSKCNEWIAYSFVSKIETFSLYAWINFRDVSRCLYLGVIRVWRICVSCRHRATCRNLILFYLLPTARLMKICMIVYCLEALLEGTICHVSYCLYACDLVFIDAIDWFLSYIGINIYLNLLLYLTSKIYASRTATVHVINVCKR